MIHQLTRDEARRSVVQAPLLDADRPGDVVEVAEQLGAIKIDPTLTTAPAEHAFLRFKPKPPHTFGFFAHPILMGVLFSDCSTPN